MSLHSWGNYPRIDNTVFDYTDEQDLHHIMQEHRNIIPYGNGRSYGDSALNTNIIHTIRHKYFLSFDENNGILHCEAGVLLSEILDVFLPRGWFLSATPGTKLITVGGAIAADVHGKNHHVAGSFGDSVLSFRLAMPDGRTLTCSPTENRELFRATCGGMGLTGVITDAHIRLQPVRSSFIDQVSVKTRSLRETIEAFEAYKEYTYSVAWIDCLAAGESLGRGILTVGEHATDGNLTYNSTAKLAIPIELPSLTLNKYSVKAFNMLYYAKAKSGVSRQKVSIDTFFYPLDAIGHWNRIYGGNGFLQYQFVLPKEESFTGLQKILSKIRDSGKGSFLVVLKLFGKGNENYLSFPMEGYTLALDFKIEPELFPLLDALDAIVLAHGGRFYLAKDSRVSKEVFEQGYPHIEAFRALRKEYNLYATLQSLQSRRIGI